jgi:TolB-like protein/predicted Zn-dependent protease
MPSKSEDPFQFWQELKRRKVIRVIAVYAAAAFVIIEVTNNIAEPLNFPDWVSRWVIILLAIGLLIAVLLSWIFDITPEGIQKTKPVDDIQIVERPVASNFWKIATYVSMLIIIALIVFNIVAGINRSNNIFKLEKSIAVLPFENWSQGEEFAHLGDAIANEICTHTTKIQGFHILSFTSTSSYKGSNKPSIPQIGKELGANFIIEGSVERQDEDVSIHVQVIQAAEDTHLWADEFTGKWKDIFTIRANIAVQIAEQLKTILSPEEIKGIKEEPTANTEAYNYYLKGNYYMNNYDTREMRERAVKMYEKAVELDSAFVLAYAKLAMAHTILYVPKTWDHTAERLERSRDNLAKAVELAPSHPEVRLAKGHYSEWIEKDFDQALKEYRMALKDQPGNSELLGSIGTILVSQGKPEEASEFFIKSYEFDPKSLNQAYWVSWSYILQRDWAEALKWIDISIAAHPDATVGYYKKAEINIYGYGDLEKALEVLEEGSRNVRDINTAYYKRIIETYKRNYQEALKFALSDTWRPHYNYIHLGQIYDWLGDSVHAKASYDSSRIMLEALVEESPENAFHHVSLGQAYAGLGNRDKALHSGTAAIELHPIQSDPYSSGENILLYFAHIKIALGEYVDAIDHLETLLTIPCQVTVWMLKLDPVYDPLRNNPRFQEIIAGLI